MESMVHVIDVVHEHCHDGNFYSTGHLFEDVASAATVDFLLITGSKSAHAAGHIVAGGECKFSFYEDSTTSAGTSVGVVNQNRESDNSANTTAVHTPTVTQTGTLIGVGLIPGGTTGNAMGGSDAGPARAGSEWILANGKKYLIRITNESNASSNISINVGFYEK